MFVSKKIRNKISASLIISLGLHFLFAWIFVQNKISSENKIRDLIASHQKNILITDFSKVKLISKKQLAELKKQIVASDQTGKKIKPTVSKFSGMTDQTFDRQTIARNNGAYNEAGKGSINASTAMGEKAEPKIVAVKSKTNPKKELKLSDLGGVNLNLRPSDVEHLEAEVEKEVAEHKAMSDSIGATNGNAAARGLASSSDFVEDVALGDVTNLNTTENKYYGFYHRIRQKLEQSWGSTIHDKAKKLYKAGRRLPASENLITAITVILNDKGNILDIKIEGTSGVRELDQAAVESFNKAGPFPNPPKGLLVGGRAVIQWGFVVKS